ncbi:MAG: membrane-bound lytic murein transglycosylase MltF [Deltaproteobacteria bacterium]|nr:membrane-bound lytic murein transglycosylase MltF [Deltaproteobacteria bacterium]
MIERTLCVPVKRWLVFMVMVLLCVFACSRNEATKRIEETGTITVITRNNAHCYYTYRGQDMGFEYDLAKAFAAFLGVELKVKVAESWDDLLPSLEEGVGDFVAASMTRTPSRSDMADFSRQYLPVEQKVIVHKNNTKIRTVADLDGKSVHVRRGTSYEERLRGLKQEGVDVRIVLHEDALTEALIEAVANREIDITIADSNVAQLNRHYYPDINIAFSVEIPQFLGWAVAKRERALLRKINKFFDKIKEDGTFDDIYSRYYAKEDTFEYLDVKRFQERMQTRLPRYEKTIKEAADLYGFDWRLIVALIYQESQFNPWAKSFSGVRGLMQLTLPTAEDLGIENRINPRESIMGGVQYFRELHDLYDKASEPDRTRIALAAYNVGKGHVLDARRIASRKNLDPNKWSSLEKILPLLSEPRYYKKSRFGYCRGREPVIHVQNIVTYYDILKREAIEYSVTDERDEAAVFHVEQEEE